MSALGPALSSRSVERTHLDLRFFPSSDSSESSTCTCLCCFLASSLFFDCSKPVVVWASAKTDDVCVLILLIFLILSKMSPGLRIIALAETVLPLRACRLCSARSRSCLLFSSAASSASGRVRLSCSSLRLSSSSRFVLDGDAIGGAFGSARLVFAAVLRFTRA